MSNLKVIKAELKEMRDFFLKVVNIIPSFHIADPDILPYGLSWTCLADWPCDSAPSGNSLRQRWQAFGT